MKKFDIFFGNFPFEEKEGSKGRPILILDDDKAAILGSKITSTEDLKHYVKIEDWKQAGLLRPSYVQLSIQKEVPKDQIAFYIGHLSDKDIKSIEYVLNKNESLFEESYLNDGNLNHLFFKILSRSKQYEMNMNGDLILTDYNTGDEVGIHLDMLQDYDLDYSIFFDPNEDEEEDDLDEAWRKPTAEGDRYLVSKNRAPLADLIQKYLVKGTHEWGYVKHPDGTVAPTELKGAEYSPYQVGIDKDYNIKVTAKTEKDLTPAKEIANKFNREYEVKSFEGRAGAGKHPFHLIIKLKDEDWDKPYVNPNDEVYEGENIKESKAEESKFAKKYPDRFEKIKELYIKNKWPMIDGEALDKVAEILNVNIKDELTEASDIKVKVYNFRPSTEEGRETYKKISEAGKLGNLQDMIEEMYPDEEEINADEMNNLLSEKSDWVLNMLDIHDEEVED